MSFESRELTRQILFAQEDQDRPLGCPQCSTTRDDDQGDDDDQVGCNDCSTTRDHDHGGGPCDQCPTTKPHHGDAKSGSAQELMLLRQQLRDSLAAG